MGPTGRAPYSTAKFGVEGFCEVLAVGMAPFGVHVTIVEPGGFRTDFAGSSTDIDAGNAAYAETVGKTAAMQRDYSGKQSARLTRSSRYRRSIDLSYGWCWAACLCARGTDRRGPARRAARMARDQHLDRLSHRPRLRPVA